MKKLLIVALIVFLFESKAPTMTETIQESVRNAGTYSGTATISRVSKRVIVSVPRMTPARPNVFTDALTPIRVATDLSCDGGMTWKFYGAFEAYGGVYIRRDGAIAQASEMLIPVTLMRDCQARITLTQKTRQRMKVEIREE